MLPASHCLGPEATDNQSTRTDVRKCSGRQPWLQRPATKLRAARGSGLARRHRRVGHADAVRGRGAVRGRQPRLGRLPGAPAPVRVSCRRCATSRRLRPTRPTMITPSTLLNNGNASETAVNGGVSTTIKRVFRVASSHVSETYEARGCGASSPAYERTRRKLYGRFKMSWLQWLRRMMQSSPYSNVSRFAMSTYASNTPGTPCTG